MLVWVEAPYDVRMRRGLERDGDAFAPLLLVVANVVSFAATIGVAALVFDGLGFGGSDPAIGSQCGTGDGVQHDQLQRLLLDRLGRVHRWIR